MWGHSLEKQDGLSLTQLFSFHIYFIFQAEPSGQISLTENLFHLDKTYTRLYILELTHIFSVQKLCSLYDLEYYIMPHRTFHLDEKIVQLVNVFLLNIINCVSKENI